MKFIFFILLGMPILAWNQNKPSLQPPTGQYFGIIPSPICNGLFSIINFHSNQSYELKLKKLGISDSFIVEKGNYTWNAPRKLLTLSGAGPESNKFLFDDNKLIVLDNSGRKHEGDEAEQASFELHQHKYIIKEIKWILKEINEEPLPQEETYRQVPYIFLPASDNSILGFDGCNSFFGKVLITDINKIQVTDINSTKMYCAQITINKTMTQNLLSAQTFTIHNDQLLILNDNKTILKFQAKF